MELDLENWMGQLTAAQASTPLTKLKIPGSHDSFTYSLDKQQPFASDLPEFARSLPPFGPIKQVIHNWSKTQTLTFFEQLMAGVRYFDMRLAHPAHADNPNEIRTVHGLYGPTLEHVLNEINDFIKDHPKEVVLLDFNHFYDMTQELHQLAMSQIMSVFGERMISRCDPDTLTLDKLWSQQKQVIVFYQHSNSNGIADQFWLADSIKSPWANSSSASRVLEHLGHSLEHRPAKQFQVLQGVVTPQVSDIMKGFQSNLEQQMATAMTQAIVSFLNGNGYPRERLNIVIVDFVEKFDFCLTVVRLN